MLSDLAESHPAMLSGEELLAQCGSRRLRRGGPGGQHRNKVETAVVLEHLPSGIAAEANERRSQGQNAEVALHRLRIKLAVELRSAAWHAPSPRWQARRHGTRIKVNPGHADFPALLAEALDALAAHEFRVPEAAAALEVSATQLVSLLRQELTALGLLNAERQSQGLGPLR